MAQTKNVCSTCLRGIEVISELIYEFEFDSPNKNRVYEAAADYLHWLHSEWRLGLHQCGMAETSLRISMKYLVSSAVVSPIFRDLDAAGISAAVKVLYKNGFTADDT